MLKINAHSFPMDSVWHMIRVAFAKMMILSNNQHDTSQKGAPCSIVLILHGDIYILRLEEILHQLIW